MDLRYTRSLLGILLALPFAADAFGRDEDPETHFDKHARRAVPRDTFDVFDEPKMLSPQEAEKRKIVSDEDFVIGVAHGEESRAYPIPVMGTAELGNDTIDGVPITVSW